VLLHHKLNSLDLRHLFAFVSCLSIGP